MYAVIKSGGKQHKVSEGEEILLEKLSLDEGEVIEFSEVLAVNKDGNLNVGKPLLEGAIVKGKVINHLKTKKITVIKMKRRK
ncbi:MAG: 50S ribosomal protein L21, partial [Gammaproteobacteria bacterium]